MLRWFDSETAHKALAITSPGRYEGRSWLTANLGVVFSQLGERTLVVDADMRSPRQHLLFGVKTAPVSRQRSRAAASDIIQRVPPCAISRCCRPALIAAQPAGSFSPAPASQLPAIARRQYDVISSTPRRQPVCRRADSGGARRRRTHVAQRNTSRIGLLQLRRHAATGRRQRRRLRVLTDR